jgi:hypothetical protein
MIDFKNQTVTGYGSAPVPITKWEVGFMTPGGVCEHLEDAVTWCQKNDMLPQLCIKPVAIATGEGGIYEAVA